MHYIVPYSVMQCRVLCSTNSALHCIVLYWCIAFYIIISPQCDLGFWLGVVMYSCSIVFWDEFQRGRTVSEHRVTLKPNMISFSEDSFNMIDETEIITVLRYHTLNVYTRSVCRSFAVERRAELVCVRPLHWWRVLSLSWSLPHGQWNRD